MRFAVLVLLLVPLTVQAYPAGSFVGEVAPGVTLVLREKLPPEEWPADIPGDYILGGFIFDDPDAMLVLGDLWIDYDEWEIPVRQLYLIRTRPDLCSPSRWPQAGIWNALGYRGGISPRQGWLMTRKSRAILAYFVCPPGSLPRPKAGTTWGYRKPNAVVMEGGGLDAEVSEPAP